MWKHPEIEISLRRLLRSGKILVAGNSALRIYGRLDCSSGKRMKKENRVFFKNEKEALLAGYRPCGHCMRASFKKWKAISTLNL